VTSYISFRERAVGGSIIHPLILAGEGSQPSRTYRPLAPAEVDAMIAGKDLLLVAHGFNVGREQGASQMAALEARLSLPPTAHFFGILWPGDFFLPVVNYPFEANDAVRCGALLAELCNRRFTQAASLSFMSHSLGGRLVLEAVSRLARKAKSLCLAAAAVDRDVLTRQYAAAFANAEHISVLSSTRDKVLKLAYPGGDLLSDLFGDSDSPFRSALGLKGPRPHPGSSLVHHPIPKRLDCDHGDYLPFGGHWESVAQHIGHCFAGTAQAWPPA
jgi:hypothetical protein